MRVKVMGMLERISVTLQKKNKKTELDADRVGELQLHVMGRIKLTFSHQGKAESQSSHLMAEYEI